MRLIFKLVIKKFPGAVDQQQWRCRSSPLLHWRWPSMMLLSKCHDDDDDDDGSLMIVDKLYEEVSCSPTMNHSWLSLRFYILPKQPNKPLNDHNQSLDAHWLSPNQCVRKLWNALVRPVGEMKLGKKTLTSFPIIHLLNPKLPKKHIFHVFTLFWVWGKPKIALTIFEKLEKTWSSNWHPASLQELGPARYINKREWNEVTPWRSHRWLEWSQSANSESTSPSPSPPGWSPSPSLWTVKMLSMENLGNWLT